MQSYMGYNHVTIKATTCALHPSMSHQSLAAKQVNSAHCTCTFLQAITEDMYTTEDPNNFRLADTKQHCVQCCSWHGDDCPLQLHDVCKAAYLLLYSYTSAQPKESFSPAWGLGPGSSSACALVEQLSKTLTLLHCRLLQLYTGLHHHCRSMHRQHVPVCDLEMSKQPCRPKPSTYFAATESLGVHTPQAFTYVDMYCSKPSLHMQVAKATGCYKLELCRLHLCVRDA